MKILSDLCYFYFQHARTNALRSLQESRSSPLVGNSRLNYFGLLKTNEGHFKRTLSKILIERVPDSTGSKTVRDFITGEMSSLGWSVQEDPFEEDTVIGKVKFTNIIATLNPVCICLGHQYCPKVLFPNLNLVFAPFLT